jgi:hypothetical protein
MIELGGRKLQVIASANIEHDCWMANTVREAGLRPFVIDEARSVDEQVNGYVDCALESGMVTTLVGGLLAPAELDLRTWRPAVAAEMTEFIRNLTAPEDKLVFRGLFGAAVAGFFRSGLASLGISPTSSRVPMGPRAGALLDPRSMAAVPPDTANGI